MAKQSIINFSYKDEYYHQQALKLTNPIASSKTYWSILKRLFNGIKVPYIPDP